MKRLGRLVRHTVEGDSDHLQSRQSHGGPKPQLSLKANNRSFPPKKQAQLEMMLSKNKFPFKHKISIQVSKSEIFGVYHATCTFSCR